MRFNKPIHSSVLLSPCNLLKHDVDLSFKIHITPLRKQTTFVLEMCNFMLLREMLYKNCVQRKLRFILSQQMLRTVLAVRVQPFYAKFFL